MKLTEYKVRVLQKHIKAGGYSAHHCPIALAVHDATGLWAAVNRDYVRLYAEGKSFEGAMYATPPAAHNFVKRYDSNKPVKPFTFTLSKRYGEAR